MVFTRAFRAAGLVAALAVGVAQATTAASPAPASTPAAPCQAGGFGASPLGTANPAPEPSAAPTVAPGASFSPGFVTKVEAFDTAAATWITLWEGADPTPTGGPGIFTPALAKIDLAVDRIRVTIDTDVPDWNQIDAVELVGAPPGR